MPQQEFPEIVKLTEKLNNSEIPQALKDKGSLLLNRGLRLLQGSNYGEFESVENYINWITRIPFGKTTADNLDIENARSVLDQHHFGLEDVKNKLLEYTAVLKLNSEKNLPTQSETLSEIDQMKVLKGSSANAPVLFFIGIQGIGKTSMGKSIANALGRKFVRIALGGMANIHELRGIPRGEKDAGPGRVVRALIDSGSMNPLLLFDELDKVSDFGGVRTDIMAALLEILDPEQNSTFIDKYIDHPVDLSKCLFIATANNAGGITSALLDRMEVVRFTSYSDDDKQQIAKQYLLTKVRQGTGLGEDQLVFTDDVWPLIIRPLGFDAGIRELERTLTKIARKSAMMIVQGKATQVIISPQNFREFIPDDFGIYT
jgi:ATP-dependent Lon protease